MNEETKKVIKDRKRIAWITVLSTSLLMTPVLGGLRVMGMLIGHFSDRLGPFATPVLLASIALYIAAVVWLTFICWRRLKRYFEDNQTSWQ